MGKQVRKSAETAHSRMQGDWRPEKHISVQTGRGRDREEEKKIIKEEKKNKKMNTKKTKKKTKEKK